MKNIIYTVAMIAGVAWSTPSSSQAVGLNYLDPPMIEGHTMAKTTSIPVLNRTVKAGHILSEADFSTKEMPSHRISNAIVRDTFEIIGKESIRTLRSGTPIYKSYIRETPDMKKGSIVQVIFNKPGIQLTSEAQSLQDASNGDRIKVINLSSKKILVGTVIGHNKVEVN